MRTLWDASVLVGPTVFLNRIEEVRYTMSFPKEACAASHAILVFVADKTDDVEIVAPVREIGEVRVAEHVGRRGAFDDVPAGRHMSDSFGTTSWVVDARSIDPLEGSGIAPSDVTSEPMNACLAVPNVHANDNYLPGGVARVPPRVHKSDAHTRPMNPRLLSLIRPELQEDDDQLADPNCRQDDGEPGDHIRRFSLTLSRGMNIGGVQSGMISAILAGSTLLLAKLKRLAQESYRNQGEQQHQRPIAPLEEASEP